MARAKTETTADIDGAVDTIEQIASEPAQHRGYRFTRHGQHQQYAFGR